jgi:hypothetical protein
MATIDPYTGTLGSRLAKHLKKKPTVMWALLI